MSFLSVCSGIEAASVAWNPLGWHAWAFSEIEPFPCALLAHRYPDVPNLGDMTNFKAWPHATVDVLCGGTPCQSFSIAGLRKGLADPRGNLMLTFGAIADKYRPRWLVWENVPGVLSSNKGRDFGAFLGMLGQLGYGFAYRILDAQYAGVPQRRRRVFVVGYLGNWRPAAAVLFERHSLSGHPAPRREAREVAPTIPARSSAGGGFGTDFDCDGGLIQQAYGGNNTSGAIDVSTALNASRSASGHLDFESETFVTGTLLAGKKSSGSATMQDANSGLLVPIAFAENSRHEVRLEGGDGARVGALSTGGGKPGQGMPMIAFDSKASGRNGFCAGNVSPTLRATAHAKIHSNAGGHVAVAYTTKLHNTASNNAGKIFEERTPCLDAKSPAPALLTASAVRRLTPRECERLQGFPDDYTLLPTWKGWRPMDASETPESCAAAGFDIRQSKKTGKWRVRDVDGPRYKALGNSWAVPVVRWIGQRIELVDAVMKQQVAA